MRRAGTCLATAAATVLAAGLSAAPSAASRDGADVACNTPALAAAILRAGTAQTLRLAPDCTYHLSKDAYQDGDGLPIITKRLTIRGRNTRIMRDQAATQRFRIFDVAAYGDLRVDSVTIKGGQSRANSDGGGIQVRSGGALSLTNSFVVGNSAADDGGGIDVAPGATAIIRHSVISDNTAGSTGGGLQSDGRVRTADSVIARNHAAEFGGGVDHESGTALFERTSLKDNSSGTSTAADGGGIDIDGGSVRFDRSSIVGNSTTGTSGGGIWNGGVLSLDQTRVTGNVAAAANAVGGGIYTTGTLRLRHSTLDANRAPGAGSQAGGLYNDGGDVSMDHSVIRENASVTAPGGVWTSNQFPVRDTWVVHNFPGNCTGSPERVAGCVN